MFDRDETAPPLHLDAVTLTLPSAAGPVDILRGVSLTVKAGERVAVVGSSGSGKSSLIAVAAGLERPTTGTASLFGTDLGPLSEDGRARLRRGRVALVFQQFHLLPNMTAQENVSAPAWADVSIIIRSSFPAENNSASPWPAPSPAVRPCYSPTSPPATSTAPMPRESLS
jgi:predicted ABC-type transport system involved in lysophospholipase L1 biosynthesis ATPase subunit